MAVVPPGTWMAGHLDSGVASGTVFERFSADSIALALQEAAARFDELDAKARACAADWRRSMSVSSFLDRLLQQLQVR